MYLQKHFVLVALSIGLLCQIQGGEAVLRLVRDNGFTYFYEVIRPRADPGVGPVSSSTLAQYAGQASPVVGPIPSLKLAQYAAQAYKAMLNTNNDPMPKVMTALW